ncbi:MAG: GNAT family N-acetyltransferase, partial [Akkermansiaceae bacterium]
MEIRDATEADLPAIVAIYNESIPGGTSTADLKPITVEERQGWFSRFDPTRRPIWVAVDEDGTIMGCVYL